MIPRAGAVARSRNLGQALFGSPVTQITFTQVIVYPRNDGLAVPWIPQCELIEIIPSSGVASNALSSPTLASMLT